MMEKNLRTILEKLEMVIRDRKVIKVSLLVCMVISVVIYIISLVKLDPKPEYNSTNKELFDVAEEVVKDGFDLSVIKNYDYLITTEDGVISISKNDNSLASNIGIEPKVIISFKEDGTYLISRNYFKEQDYHNNYIFNIIAFTILFIISLTAILYVVEIMAAFILDVIVTMILNLSIDIRVKKKQLQKKSSIIS